MPKASPIKPLVIAVANFSGNTGKTLLVDHAIMPRLDDAKLVRVESINHTGEAGTRLRAEHFGQLQDMILDGGSVVMDIGASNIETMLEAMRDYDGSHEDIDRFVVPVVPDTKQQIDTIATVRALTDLGVEPSAIRVVLNRMPKRMQPEEAFPAIFALQDSIRFRLDPAAHIGESEVFNLLKMLRRSLIDLADDATDYRAQLASAQPTEALSIKNTIRAQRLARPLSSQLDYVFEFIARK